MLFLEKRVIKRIKEQLKKYRIVMFLREYIFNIKLEEYEKEVQKRKQYSIFDYKNLSKEMKLVTKEYGYNAFYGLAGIVKKGIGWDENVILDAAIEHGPYPKNVISEVDSLKEIMYTLSERRSSYLRTVFPNKTIYAIGPYIQYVKPILSEAEMTSLKNKYGKILLVFHAHSTPHVSVDFEQNDFINKVEEIKDKGKFDTVMVCMYWKDVLRTKDVEFFNKEYKICTAGHMFDPNFLLRLKSIIALSDMTMSNSAGTHVGYCVCLNKAHYLVYNDLKITHANTEHENPEEDEQYYNEFLSKALKCFGTYKETIEDKDLEFVREYWGNW